MACSTLAHFTNHTGCVRVVYHDHCAMFLGNFHNFREGCNITIHRENSVGTNNF